MVISIYADHVPDLVSKMHEVSTFALLFADDARTRLVCPGLDG